MIPREEWSWWGVAGHLIVGRDCRYHLATAVGPWWVSTVGEWLPDSAVREILAQSRGLELEGRGDDRERSWMRLNGYEEIGAGRKYETTVFRAGPPCDAEECGRCGLPIPADFHELDADGYNSPADAHAGHYAMCEKWAAVPVEDGDARRGGVVSPPAGDPTVVRVELVLGIPMGVGETTVEALAAAQTLVAAIEAQTKAAGVIVIVREVTLG